MFRTVYMNPAADNCTVRYSNQLPGRTAMAVRPRSSVLGRMIKRVEARGASFESRSSPRVRSPIDISDALVLCY